MLKKKLVAIVFLLVFFQLSLLCKGLSEPALVYEVNGKWTALDETGKTLFTSEVLLDVESYSEGLLGGYAYHNDNVVSIYYDKTGKIELASNSVRANPFKDNYALVTEEKKLGTKQYEYKYGIINRKGEIVIPIKYLDAEPFSEGLAYVMNQEERGFIDTNGKFIAKLEKGEAGYGFSEGLSPVSRIDIAKFGFIDKEGNLVIDYEYQEAKKFSEGLASVLFANSHYGVEFFGYINTSGDLVINNIYSEAASFTEGLAFVGGMIDGELRWGIINKDGIHLAEHVFSEYKNFSDSVAVVKNVSDSLYYYIDYQSKSLNTNKYKYCGSFNSGKAFVILSDDKKYFIDKKGNYLFEIPKEAGIVLDCRTNEKYSVKKDKK